MIQNNYIIPNKFSILILILLIFSIILIIPQQSQTTAQAAAEASVKPVAGVEYTYSMPGEIAEYKLRLKNNGNLRETFIIDRKCYISSLPPYKSDKLKYQVFS